LNNLEGQYCDRNCIDCSVSSRARCFYCEKYCKTCVRYSACYFTLWLFISPDKN